MTNSAINQTLARRSLFGGFIYFILYAILLLLTPLSTHHFGQSLIIGGLLLMGGTFRYLISRRLAHMPGNISDIGRTLFCLTVLTSSLTWGVLCFLSICENGMSSATYSLLFATAGIASGSVLSLAPAFPLITAHLALLLFPIIAGSALVPGQNVYSLIAIIYLIYQVLQARMICKSANTDLQKTEVIEQQKIALEQSAHKSLAASQAKTRFLAMMTHEIRTPLAGTIGMADMLLKQELGSVAHAHIKVMKNCSENLLLIMNDILDYSQMENGKITFSESPFNLLDAISEVIKLFENVATKKGLSLKYFVNPALPHEWLGDADRIKQILVNLLGNSVKFTERGQIVLTVGAEMSNADTYDVSFSVSDTGAGISPPEREEIFNLFVQSEMNPNRRFGGAGVGLAVCKRLCEGMGGKIELESELGRGSTFTFTVHLKSANPVMEAPSAKPEPTFAQNQNIKILVAEDNFINQQIVSAMLRQLGYPSIELVNNGKEALQALESRAYHLVLMDCQMPELDGYAATQEIRKNHPSLPIIALTANSLQGDREKCLQSGMNDYLVKPLNEQALNRILKKWLALPEDIRLRA